MKDTEVVEPDVLYFLTCFADVHATTGARSTLDVQWSTYLIKAIRVRLHHVATGTDSTRFHEIMTNFHQHSPCTSSSTTTTSESKQGTGWQSIPLSSERPRIVREGAAVRMLCVSGLPLVLSGMVQDDTQGPSFSMMGHTALPDNDTTSQTTLIRHTELCQLQPVHAEAKLKAHRHIHRQTQRWHGLLEIIQERDDLSGSLTQSTELSNSFMFGSATNSSLFGSLQASQTTTNSDASDHHARFPAGRSTAKNTSASDSDTDTEGLANGVRGELLRVVLSIELDLQKETHELQ